MTDGMEQYDRLSAYLDGELDDADRRDVEALLARDGEARTLLEQLRRTSTFVRNLPRVAAPGDVATAVSDRLAREALFDAKAGAERKNLSRIMVWSNRFAIAAVLGLVCTAGWLGWQRLPRPAAEVAVKAPPERFRSPPALVEGKSRASGNDARANGISDRLADGSFPRDRTDMFGKPGPTPSGGSRDVDLDANRPAEVGASRELKPAPPSASEDVESQAPMALRKKPVLDPVPAAAPPVSFGATLTPTDDAETAKVADADTDSDGFVPAGDRQRLMANSLVQQVPFKTVANQIEIIADARTQVAAVTALNDFAAANQIEDLRRQDETQLVASDSNYYFQGEPPVNYGKRSSEGEVSYLIHLPLSQATALLNQMHHAVSRDAEAPSVVANGRPVGDLAEASTWVSPDAAGTMGEKEQTTALAGHSGTSAGFGGGARGGPIMHGNPGAESSKDASTKSEATAADEPLSLNQTESTDPNSNRAEADEAAEASLERNGEKRATPIPAANSPSQRPSGPSSGGGGTGMQQAKKDRSLDDEHREQAPPEPARFRSTPARPQPMDVQDKQDASPRLDQFVTLAITIRSPRPDDPFIQSAIGRVSRSATSRSAADAADLSVPAGPPPASRPTANQDPG